MGEIGNTRGIDNTQAFGDELGLHDGDLLGEAEGSGVTRMIGIGSIGADAGGVRGREHKREWQGIMS